MPGLTSVSHFPSREQHSFEESLLTDPARQDEVFTPAILEDRYVLSSSDALMILKCAYRKGLLEKRPDGSFVRKPPEPPQITSVFQHAQKSGLKPISLVREVKLVPASKPMAEKLQLSEGAPVYEQIRSRLINDQVVANQHNTIPHCVTPNLEQMDLKARSFQVSLENDFHAVVHAIEETYRMASPTTEDQQILALDAAEQVLVVERLSLSTTEMPLVWADIHVNPAHFYLVEALWPKAKNLVNSET